MSQNLCILLIVGLILLSSCAPFGPEQDIQDIDVIVPTARVILTPTVHTALPMNTNVIPISTDITLPVPTITPTTGHPLPTINQTLIPTLTPSTIPPITAIFLTPTANWQPVQVDHAVIEIPIGWFSYSPPGGDGASFVSVDPEILSQEGTLDEGLAWVEYLEGSPDPSPEEWETVIVDGYSAKYNVLTDSKFSENPLWFGILHIHTQNRRHNIQLRCSAPSTLGEPSQREFHAYCESIIQHWIETTQILE